MNGIPAELLPVLWFGGLLCLSLGLRHLFFTR